VCVRACGVCVCMCVNEWVVCVCECQCECDCFFMKEWVAYVFLYEFYGIWSYI